MSMSTDDEYVHVEWEDPTTTIGTSTSTINASPLDLLMRHSSPFTAQGTEEGAVLSSMTSTTTLTERTTSPSLLLRPRSNPRTRTPMRYVDTVGAGADFHQRTTMAVGGGGESPVRGATAAAAAGTGITIRSNAGRAVGTALRLRPLDPHRSTTIVEDRPIMTNMKSNKQGPSHRKVRRWNNENFVHLAAELYKNNGTTGSRGGGTAAGRAAAHALLKGHAHAAQYQSIIEKSDDMNDPPRHDASSSNVMIRLLRDDQGRFTTTLRDELFDDEVAVPHPHPTAHTTRTPRRRSPTHSRTLLTPEDMLRRIEPRLRNVVLRACEHSMPASLVVNHVEDFLIRTHHPSPPPNPTTTTTTEDDWWRDILLEPPKVTHVSLEDHDSITTTMTTTTTQFVFDGHSPNGGFHRLLMHGLCQFHGLKASSTTMNVTTPHGTNVEARLLVATGTITETLKNVKMVDYIMLRKEARDGGVVVTPVPNAHRMQESLQALKV